MIIADLDGTIALIDHRRHLVEKPSDKYVQCTCAPGNEADECKKPCDGLLTRTFDSSKWKPDWEKFYDLCGMDKPNVPVIELLATMRHMHEIIIFSGRTEKVRLKTMAWLTHYDVPYNKLIMRPEFDYTPDDKLKCDWLNRWFPEGSDRRKDILFVLDDRQKVVDMWRAQGLTCFQVAPGNF